MYHSTLGLRVKTKEIGGGEASWGECGGKGGWEVVEGGGAGSLRGRERGDTFQEESTLRVSVSECECECE